MTEAFWLRFWGVRGSVPVAGLETVRYGGNTACVQVQVGNRTFILDAGTGIRPLGELLTRGHETLDILFSHTHLDHIMGLPFFKPAYDPARLVRLWAGNLGKEGYNLKQALGTLMQTPLFPLSPDNLRATVEYHDFEAGMRLAHPDWDAEGIRIDTLAMPHPGGSTAYRISYLERSVVYATDVEQPPDTFNDTFIRFAEGADCLIYDGTFDDVDIARQGTYGHSSWQQAVRIAELARVGTLVVFHHDPSATDDVLDQRSSELVDARVAAVLAREGLSLRLL